jgi:hypothetical protein
LESNRKELVGPRQAAMFLVKDLTQDLCLRLSITVLWCLPPKARPNDPDLNKIINSVTDSFQWA